MPRYRIESPEGRWMEVEGERPPTQEESAALFSSVSQPAAGAPPVGVSGLAPAPSPQPFSLMPDVPTLPGMVALGMGGNIQTPIEMPAESPSPAELASIPLHWAGQRFLDVVDLPTTLATKLQAAKMGIRGFSGEELRQAFPERFPEPLTQESPTPQIPTIPESAVEGMAKPVQWGAGAVNTGIGLVQSMVPPFAPPDVGISSPLVMGGGVMGRVAAGLFAPPMLLSVPEQVFQATEAVQDPTISSMRTAEAVAQPGVSTLLGGAMLKHALMGRKVPQTLEQRPLNPGGARADLPPELAVLEAENARKQKEIADAFKASLLQKEVIPVEKEVQKGPPEVLGPPSPTASVPSTPVTPTPPTPAEMARTMMDPGFAELRHNILPWLSKEQQQQVVDHYVRTGDVEGAKAVAKPFFDAEIARRKAAAAGGKVPTTPVTPPVESSGPLRVKREGYGIEGMGEKDGEPFASAVKKAEAISTPQWSVQHGRDYRAWRGMGEKELQEAMRTGTFKGRGGPYVVPRPDKPLYFAKKSKGTGYLVEFRDTYVQGERVKDLPLKKVAAVWEIKNDMVRRVPFKELNDRFGVKTPPVQAVPPTATGETPGTKAPVVGEQPAPVVPPVVEPTKTVVAEPATSAPEPKQNAKGFWYFENQPGKFYANRESAVKAYGKPRPPGVAEIPKLVAPKELTTRFKPGVQHDANQMIGWLKNNHPSEARVLEDMGVFKGFEGMKVKPETLSKYIEENGPRVEVRKFGEGAKTEVEDKLQTEKAQLEHSLDTKYPWWRDSVTSPRDVEAYNRLTDVARKEFDEMTGKANEVSRKIAELQYGQDRNVNRAHWSSVAPKAEKDMPGYVELAVVKPRRATMEGLNPGEKPELENYKFPSSHSFPPNTAVFVRGYMETLPNGKKAFHVIEVQSDWGRIREEDASYQPGIKTASGKWYVTHDKTFEFRKDAQEHLNKQSALLRDYNRLALKAAIEHARKEGADSVIVQDAESAMLMEGHDQAARINTTETARRPDGSIYYPKKIDQEPGMRLNYDTILPRIMEELTGSKGERVSLGEHKNAYEDRNIGSVNPNEGKPRPNLIFRNPDGTPKTDVSGLAYDISHLPKEPEFSLFGKDRYKAPPPAEAPVQQLDKSKLPEYVRDEVEALGLKEGGTVYDALTKLAEQPNTFDATKATLASFLLRHFPETLKERKVGLGVVPEYGRAGYDPVHKTAYLNITSEGTPAWKLLHEGTHAATEWAFTHPKNEAQRMAVLSLKGIRQMALNGLTAKERQFITGDVQELFRRNEARSPFDWAAFTEKMDEKGLDADKLELFYALGNEGEMLAGIFSSKMVREYLNGIEAGKRTLWDRVVDAVYDLLGIKKGSALDAAFQEMIRAGDERGGTVKEGTPPVAEAPLRALVNAYRDSKDAIPDLKPKNEANREAAIKFATERMPVIGRVLGGKARIKEPIDEAISAWYAERHGVGPAIASALGEQIRGKLDAFKVDRQGDLNVTARDPNASLKPSDVFETLERDPGAYTLSPEQRDALDLTIKPILNRMRKLTKQYDLVDIVDEHGEFKPYFPRIVIELPREGTVGGRGKVGAKQPFQKERIFDTEAEGVGQEVKYEPSLEKRLVTGTERLYRAIADKRLATDPVVGGRNRAQLLSDLRAAYPGKTPDQLRKIANSLQAQGQVLSPAFFGRIFKPEVARLLNKEFNAENSRVRKVLANTNSIMKGVKLGFDFGVGQIQLLPTLYANPPAWALAQAKSMGAFFKPEVFSNYVRNNIGAVREMAQLGSSVGRLQEYMSGISKGSPLTRIPVVGTVAEAFGRQFQTALDVAKIEYWKAWRDVAKKWDPATRTLVTDKSEWPKLMRSIESVLGSGRMESAMVPHGRALLERTALLAPSYYRGAVDFVAALAESGVSGNVARRAMGAFVVGTLASFYAMAKWNKMSDDEIVQRLDPSRPDFLMWDVKMDDGKILHVGTGGVFRSFLRLFGNMAATSIEHPGNWNSLDPAKNPVSRWLRGHAGPVPGAVWNQFSGRDFLGRRTTVSREIPESILPLAATQEGGMVDKALGVIGVSGWQAPPLSAEQRALRAGKELGELPIWERRDIGREMAREKQPRSPAEQALTEQRTAERRQERMEKVIGGLPKSQRQWLEEKNLQLPQFDTTLELRSTDIPLTDAERKRYVQYITEEYQNFIEETMTRTDTVGMGRYQLQALLDKRLEIARRRAKNRINREVRAVGQ